MVGCGPAIGRAAEAELECLEMNQSDHLRGHQWITECGGDEREIGERMARTGESRSERTAAGLLDVHLDRELIAIEWRVEPEVVGRRAAARVGRNERSVWSTVRLCE